MPHTSAAARPHRVRTVPLWLLLLLVLAMVASTSGCLGLGGASHHAGAAAGGSDEPGVKVAGLSASTHVNVKDTGVADNAGLPTPGLRFASHVYSLTPSGPLEQTATVTLPLTEVAPAGAPVIIATKESTGGRWSYLPATLTSDRRHVTFTTTHFTLFGAILAPLGDLVSLFKDVGRDIVDGLTSDLTKNVQPPRCDQESTARGDGYKITSSNGGTVNWCFGVGGNGVRVLKLTNRKSFVLEVAHPNMGVLSNPAEPELASASRAVSGKYLILAPGGTATFNADLGPGESEGISTELDGFGQSLYALQVGVETAAVFLGKFGYAAAKSTAKIMADLMSYPGCAAAMFKGAGSIVSACMDVKMLREIFGNLGGLLLAPVVLASPIIAFFRSQTSAFISQFNNSDKYQVAITRSSAVQTLNWDDSNFMKNPGVVNATLVGTDAAFRSFIASEIREQNKYGEQCPDAAHGVSVDRWRSDGWALGGVNNCGGNAVIWHRSNGGWKDVLGTQDNWCSSDFKRLGIPTALLADPGKFEPALTPDC